MIMDVVTDALSPSAIAPYIDSNPADLYLSNSCAGQIALDCPDQPPKKGCFSRRILYHCHHHSFCNNSCGCGQLFQPPTGPNMAVHVEFHRADCL